MIIIKRESSRENHLSPALDLNTFFLFIYFLSRIYLPAPSEMIFKHCLLLLVGLFLSVSLSLSPSNRTRLSVIPRASEFSEAVFFFSLTRPPRPPYPHVYIQFTRYTLYCIYTHIGTVNNSTNHHRRARPADGRTRSKNDRRTRKK